MPHLGGEAGPQLTCSLRVPLLPCGPGQGRGHRGELAVGVHSSLLWYVGFDSFSVETALAWLPGHDAHLQEGGGEELVLGMTSVFMPLWRAVTGW